MRALHAGGCAEAAGAAGGGGGEGGQLSLQRLASAALCCFDGNSPAALPPTHAPRLEPVGGGGGGCGRALPLRRLAARQPDRPAGGCCPRAAPKPPFASAPRAASSQAHDAQASASCSLSNRRHPPAPPPFPLTPRSPCPPSLLPTSHQLVRDLLAKGKAHGFNVMRTWAHAVNPQYATQVGHALRQRRAGQGGGRPGMEGLRVGQGCVRVLRCQQLHLPTSSQPPHRPPPASSTRRRCAGWTM